MPTRLTVTITTSNTDGETRRSETTACADMLAKVEQQLVTNPQITSGTIADRNHNLTTTYTYVPTAAA
jgi:hypothetical protein